MSSAFLTVARRVTAVGGIPQLAVIGRFLLDALAPHRCVDCKKLARWCARNAGQQLNVNFKLHPTKPIAVNGDVC